MARVLKDATMDNPNLSLGNPLGMAQLFAVRNSQHTKPGSYNPWQQYAILCNDCILGYIGMVFYWIILDLRSPGAVQNFGTGWASEQGGVHGVTDVDLGEAWGSGPRHAPWLVGPWDDAK